MARRTTELLTTFRVRCLGQLHSISLTKRGTLILHDHPDVTCDEIVGIMGGDQCRCLQVQELWDEFARNRRHGTSRRRRVQVPARLPPKLKLMGSQVTEKERERAYRLQIDKQYRLLHTLPLSELSQVPRSPTKVRKELHHIWLRFRERCVEIAYEVNDRLTYELPSTHSWGEPKLDVPHYLRGPNDIVRPTFKAVDSPVYHDQQCDLIIGITRSIRWHINPLLMIRAHVKTGCLLRDDKGRIIATSALARKRPQDPPGCELLYAARQYDDMTVRGCWCLAKKGPDGTWDVVRWLRRPPRNIIKESTTWTAS